MERLIATVDIPGCPVIKPQSCLLSGQIRNPAVFCRILSSAGISAGLISKQCIIQTEAPVFRCHTKRFKYIVRDLYRLHPPRDPLEDAGLQDHFRILCMYFVRQLLRQSEMLLVIHRHIPDARCSSKKFYAHFPDRTQIVFQCFALIQTCCRHTPGQVIFQNFSGDIAIKCKIHRFSSVTFPLYETLLPSLLFS